MNALLIALREQTAAIQCLADSNMALVAAMAKAEDEDDTADRQTLDGD